MRSLTYKLAPGTDLRLFLEELAKRDQANGFVLGVVGNLSRASFQCPGKSAPTILEGNLEIITLNGTFSPSGVHLHLSLSDGDCQVWGGHLEPGTTILKGAELLVGVLDTSSNNLNNNINDNTNDNTNTERLELVVLPGCPWSSRAMRILNNSEIPYFTTIIDNDSAFTEFKQRSNMSTFPQLFFDGELLGGYESLQDLKSSGQLVKLK